MVAEKYPCRRARHVLQLSPKVSERHRKLKMRVRCTVHDWWAERGCAEQSRSERNTWGGVGMYRGRSNKSEEVEKEAETEVLFPLFCSIGPVWHIWSLFSYTFSAGKMYQALLFSSHGLMDVICPFLQNHFYISTVIAVHTLDTYTHWIFAVFSLML